MSQISSSPKPYYPHVDGLRAIAVIGVLLSHFNIPGFPGGFLGVDVFFVVSGFLITRLIIQERGRTGQFSYRNFYLRRIRRLMPAALAVIALSIAAFYPIFGAKDLSSFLRSVPFVVFSLANLNFYREVGYFDSAAKFKPLLHTWSLAVEEQFYLIWPTLLLLLMRFGRWLLPVSLILLVISVTGAAIIRPLNFSAAYYLLPFRSFELMVGAALATVMAEQSPDYRNIQTLSEWRMALLAGLGMALVLGCYFLFSKTSPLPGPLSLLACIGTALVIAYGAHGPVGQLLTWRPVVWIGLISYSLYLVHWPVFVYISYRLLDMPSLPLRMAMFPISIMLATASYYLIEQPFRQPASKENRWGNRPFAAATVLVACLLVAPSAYHRLVDPKQQPRLIAELSVPPQGQAIHLTKVSYPEDHPVYEIFRYETGLPDAPKLLVLGDSHGEHLREGLQRVIAPNGIDVDLARISGCPPLFDITIQRETDKAPDQGCTAANETLKLLARSQDYDAVVLTSRWGLAVGRRDMPGQRLRHIDYVQIGDRKPELGMEKTRALFSKAIEKTVNAILATGKPVILMGQVPPTGTDLNQCQSPFPWLRATKGGRCLQLTEAEVAQREAFSDNLLADYKRRPGVLVINSREMMCQDGSCVTNAPQTGEILYMDDNHLNEAGSVYYLYQLATRSRFLDFIRAAARSRGEKRIGAAVHQLP
ncbi:acyltransferase family protein [Rhizobium halophytocola]|uniref:Peptidoglycan/LPS O-acetylase OafA/YrhL n=1 Tax=Rhizobium halophytocola TaxID=735519 RepID=A0ABS4E0F6_9HYPH|nr:acyltransferase family protein [Rhizobium halophytocola]MBP1851423.1 peptidoglycan/LPS O-acetylase OafA/YrhL [Rhizobium halophytocola]